MTHFFIVHSSLTNAMARHIIKKEQVPVDKVCFLLGRNYLLTDNLYKAIKIPYTHYPVDFFAVEITFWKSWSKIKKFDEWLSKISANQPFYWYADHSYNTSFYLAVSHPQCQGYYFIEEGLVVYYQEKKWAIQKTQNPLRALLYSLNFGKRNNPNRNYFDIKAGNYLGCFGIREESFGSLPNKKIVGSPFAVREFDEKYSCILVHDGTYEEMGKEAYLKVVRLMVQDALKRGYKQIHQKFHPSQAVETIEHVNKEISTLINNKAQVFTLDNTTSLEEIAVSQQPVFYLLLSSVGVYALHVGSVVISAINLFYEEFPARKKEFEGIFPSFYLDNIEYL